MKVILEERSGIIKDNNLKSQLVQKGFGFRKGTETCLDLFECLYFLENKKIKVVDKNNKVIAKDRLEKICKKEIANFINKYLVFKEFINKGFIVKEGNTFGFDFRIYRKSKVGEHTHTEMVVDVLKNKIDNNQLIKSERLATTIHAKFVLAIVDKEEKIKLLKIERI